MKSEGITERRLTASTPVTKTNPVIPSRKPGVRGGGTASLTVFTVRPVAQEPPAGAQAFSKYLFLSNVWDSRSQVSRVGFWEAPVAQQNTGLFIF